MDTILACPLPRKKICTSSLDTHDHVEHEFGKDLDLAAQVDPESSCDHSMQVQLPSKTNSAVIVDSDSEQPGGTMDDERRVAVPSLIIDSDQEQDDDRSYVGKALRDKYKQLTEEQQFFCDLLVGSQCNLFFTGVPGSGKTHTLRIARDMLLEHKAKSVMQSERIEITKAKLLNRIAMIAEEYPICAPTAMAASHIPGATTMHSALSLPIRLDGPLPTISQLTAKQIEKYRRMEVLFIDEVSMVHPKLFQYLIHVIDLARTVKPSSYRSDRLVHRLPRIVLMGDFHQLPPVDTRSWQEQRESPLPKLFELDLWQQLEFKTVYLERSVRQDTDPEFFEMNMALREGNITDKVTEYLKRKQRDYIDTWRLVDKERQLYNKPTRLCTTNAKVDAENQIELTALKQPIISHVGSIIVTKDDYKTVQQKSIDLVTSGYDAIHTDQYHIWHDAELSIDNTMEAKLTAIKTRWPVKSRLAVGAQVVLTVNLESILQGPSALINGLKGVVTGFEDEYPKVHFVNQRKVIIRPWLSEVEQQTKPYDAKERRVKKERSIIYTLSLPLRLAWAETIHSAQGSTLSMVHIQTHGTMQPGQFYVASSRCKNGADVSWDKFDHRCIVVDAKVKDFYAKIKQEKMMNQLYE